MLLQLLILKITGEIIIIDWPGKSSSPFSGTEGAEAGRHLYCKGWWEWWRPAGRSLGPQEEPQV